MEKEQLTKMVSKLNRLTKEGKIEWERMEAPENITKGTDSEVPFFYGTTYGGKKIGVYEERYKAYDEDRDALYWNERPVLALFTENWELEFEFPRVIGTYDLIKTIQYRFADVEGFINKILKEK